MFNLGRPDSYVALSLICSGFFIMKNLSYSFRLYDMSIPKSKEEWLELFSHVYELDEEHEGKKNIFGDIFLQLIILWKHRRYDTFTDVIFRSLHDNIGS